MRVVLLCATRRGYLVLQKLTELLPKCDLIVLSFREEPWEPPFFDDIKQLTNAKQGKFIEARQAGSPKLRSFWESTVIDLMLVVSWRYLIPPDVYKRARYGTYVFHDSLLPEYRGFSPTVWAIINGEDHTGVTLFEIAEDVDTGSIVDQERVSIGPDETIETVMERVTGKYLDLLERNLDKLLGAGIQPYPQDSSRVSYGCKRLPEDNRIDWKLSAQCVHNLVRAVTHPYPGAYTFLKGRRLRIWAAQRVADGRRYVGRIPGRVVQVVPSEGSIVLTDNGALLISRVQFDGEAEVHAAELLTGLNMTLGQ